jgi:hypothetical protein
MGVIICLYKRYETVSYKYRITTVDTKPHTDFAKFNLRWKTLAVLALRLMLIGMDNTILNVAIPALQTQFSASASQLQWMVDSYILVFAGLLLAMGGLGDRGRNCSGSGW